MNKFLVFFSIVLFVFWSSPTHAWWQPHSFENITWHWQLLDDVDMNKDVVMYDIDLFDATSDQIAQLHAQGKKVICYFSVGALEFTNSSHDTPVRPDNPPFPLDEYNWDFVGDEVEAYPKELWLDIRANNIYKIKPTIEGRFDLARGKGCDGVELDNVNEYEVDDDDPTELPVQNEDWSPGTTGFSPIITAQDQLSYNVWLAQQAHERDLSVGLKNDIYQLDDLVNHFDWALNEQCYEFTSGDYDECAFYDVFDNANKAVFGVEYNLNTNTFCSKSNAKGRYWAKKHIALDAYQENCRYTQLIIANHTSIHSGFLPIYRLYNTRTGMHLYARGKNDANKILLKWTDFEFTDRTPAFYAPLAEQSGFIPIYRLYNRRTGTQLYTRGKSDRDKILNKYKDFEFTDGTPAFYAPLAEQSGFIPIYRLYNKRTGAQLYTRGVTDRDKILNKWSDFEFTDGTPAFYMSLQ